MYTVLECASLLDLTVSAVYLAIAEHRLDAVRQRIGRHKTQLLITGAALRAFKKKVDNRKKRA